MERIRARKNRFVALPLHAMFLLLAVTLVVLQDFIHEPDQPHKGGGTNPTPPLPKRYFQKMPCESCEMREKMPPRRCGRDALLITKSFEFKNRGLGVGATTAHFVMDADLELVRSTSLQHRCFDVLAPINKFVTVRITYGSKEGNASSSRCVGPKAATGSPVARPRRRQPRQQSR